MRFAACGLTVLAISLLFSVIILSYSSASNHKSSLKSISFQQTFVFPPLKACFEDYIVLLTHSLLSSLRLWGNRSKKCGSNYDPYKVLAEL